MYQLRVELSTTSMTSCVPCLVKNSISCIERDGYTNVHQLEGSYTVLLYPSLYTIISTHTELLNNIDNTVVISCYLLLFKPCWKKIYFRGRWQAHKVPNIAHFMLLLRSDENTVSGKSFNAVSLGVPSTWPPNCAHIIIIHFLETPLWYFIEVLLFHVQKLLN